MLDPVKDSQGHVFNRADIEAFLVDTGIIYLFDFIILIIPIIISINFFIYLFSRLNYFYFNYSFIII